MLTWDLHFTYSKWKLLCGLAELHKSEFNLSVLVLILCLIFLLPSYFCAFHSSIQDNVCSWLLIRLLKNRLEVKPTQHEVPCPAFIFKIVSVSTASEASIWLVVYKAVRLNQKSIDSQIMPPLLTLIHTFGKFWISPTFILNKLLSAQEASIQLVAACCLHLTTFISLKNWGCRSGWSRLSGISCSFDTYIFEATNQKQVPHHHQLSW